MNLFLEFRMNFKNSKSAGYDIRSRTIWYKGKIKAFRRSLPEKYFTALQTIATDKSFKSILERKAQQIGKKNIASLNSCGKNLFELVC